MDDWWGEGSGPAKIKHTDWAGDGLVQTDEVSHALVGYKITQAGTGLARWSGLSDGTSRAVGAGISLTILTLVEYPIDTYNPIHGFGYTDMIANILGTGFAVARDRWPKKLGFIDLRISVKDFGGVNSEVIAQNTKQYDNFIYWITANPARRFPVHPALGYSANHNDSLEIGEREIYLGFGTSAGEIISFFDEELARRLDPLNFYEFSFAFRLN